MTTRLIMISHAATAAMRQGRFPDDDALDARGLSDAIEWRTHRPIVADARLLCSPRLSAMSTAKALEMDAHPVDALDDVNFGQWRGRGIAEVAVEAGAEIQAWTRDASTTPPGGESFDDVRERVGQWMDDLESSITVIAVTHAAIIRAAVLHAMQVPSSAFRRLEVPPLAVTELRRSRRGWTWWPAVS